MLLQFGKGIVHLVSVAVAVADEKVVHYAINLKRLYEPPFLLSCWVEAELVVVEQPGTSLCALLLTSSAPRGEGDMTGNKFIPPVNGVGFLWFPYPSF